MNMGWHKQQCNGLMIPLAQAASMCHTSKPLQARGEK
jgi:hypothetical protein